MEINYNIKTSFECIRELSERKLDRDVKYKLIGLNLILSSLEMKKSGIVYEPTRDTSLTAFTGMKVAENLTKITSDVALKDVDSVLSALEFQLESFKSYTQENKFMRDHITSQPLYEVGILYFFRKGSYTDLGARIEESFYNERSIRENLNEFKKTMKKLGYFNPIHPFYKSIIIQLTSLKGRVFSKEATLMRRQLVKLLGIED